MHSSHVQLTQRAILMFTFGVLALVVLLAPVAQAQLVNNLLVDGAAMSLGNAVTADPPKVNSIHYNAAGLTRLKGRHVSVSSTFIYAQASTEFSAPADYRIFSSEDRDNNPILNGTLKSKVTRADQNPVILVPGGHSPLRPPKALPIPVGVLPGFGVSINPPGSKFTFANASYLQLAGGTTMGDTNPLKYQAQTQATMRFTYAAPAVAYEVNDRLSVGMSVGFNYHGVYTQKRAVAPNMLGGMNEMIQDALCGPPDDRQGFALAFLYNPCGGNIGPFDESGTATIKMEDTLSTHWTLGVLWQATDWMTIGVNYQSESEVELAGTMDIEFREDWYNYYRQYRQSLYGALNADQFNTPHGLAREQGNITMDMVYPQKLDIGVSFQITPRWKVNVDAHWMDWGVMDEFKINLDRDFEAFSAAMILRFDIFRPNSTVSKVKFKSTTSLAIGTEYTVNERLKLRFGIENRPDAVDDAFAPANAALADTVLFGAGAEYQWDNESVMEFYVTYFESERDLPANTSQNANLDSLLNVSTNPYAGLDIKSDLSVLMWGVKYTKQW